MYYIYFKQFNMKTIKAIFFTIGVLTLSIFYPPKGGHANSGGSPGGRSNSVGDGGATCTTCHGGSETADQSGYITSNIPQEGYTPGQTYTITLSGANQGSTRIGFEFSAENSNGVTAGSLTAGTGSRLISFNGHLTHTSNGAFHTGGNFSWSFDWTAPTAGTGNVTFSTSVLFTNNNGGTSGDNVRTALLTVSEAQTTSIDEENTNKLVVYPNPSADFVSFNNTEILTVDILGLNGQLVLSTTINPSEKIDLSDLPKANYQLIARELSGKIMLTEKLIKL